MLNQTFKKAITQDIYDLVFLVWYTFKAIMTQLFNWFQ